MAAKVDAVVARESTLATLRLETGLSTYVRYSGDWQVLASDSDALDHLALVQVDPGALAVVDATEAAVRPCLIFDLPVPSSRHGGNLGESEPYRSDLAAAVAACGAGGSDPLTAAGAAIPVIRAGEDLGMAYLYGNPHPDARWKIMKWAKAPGAMSTVT